MLALYLILFLYTTSVYAQSSCACSRTGTSNGVDTGNPNCRLATPSARTPTCFVESSETCPEAQASSEIEGAAFINCPVDDALFYAAETDDVESIIRFRKLGESLNVTKSFPVGNTGELKLSLVSFAAAYGSFAVVQNLLINVDYVCGEELNVRDALCVLSDKEACQDNDLRNRMLSLINFTYRPRCEVGAARCVLVPVRGVPFEDFPVTCTVVRDCEGYPYFVSIRSSFDGGYNHRCGGVLIAPDAVLTAAHCLDGSQGTFDPILVIDAYSLEQSEDCKLKNEIRSARTIVLHPRWSKGRYAFGIGNGYDIALVQLSEPSTKTPINISSETTLTVGESLNFLEMGRGSPNGVFENDLQIHEVEADDPAICGQEYPGGVGRNMFCVGRDGYNLCIGDDGGPLFRNTSRGHELVGIAHLQHPDKGCGISKIPGLYSNAARLRRWINNTISTKF